MKRLISLIVGFMFIALSVFSQTKFELAKELISLINTDSANTQKKIVDIMKPMYKMQIEMQIINKDPSVKAKIESALEDIMTFAEKQHEEIVNVKTPELYTKYFSEQELKDLITLYKSDIWKKQIELSAKITAELMQLSTQNNLKLQEIIQKKAKEINNSK